MRDLKLTAKNGSRGDQLPGDWQYSWQLQEAKAGFSEVVRRARKQSRRVTVRGRDAVVMMSIEEYEKCSPAANCGLDELMANSPLREINFEHAGMEMPIREVSL